MTHQQLLEQLEEYPRRKVSILTKYLCGQFAKNSSSESDKHWLNAKDLAKMYGISEVTAHKVLEELSQIKSGLYIPGRNNSYSTRKSYRIAVSSESLSTRESHYSYELAPFNLDRDTALQRLEELGHAPVLFSIEELQRMNWKSSEFDGFLLKKLPGEEFQEYILQKSIPLVLIQVGTIEPTQFHSVSSELMLAYSELLDLWKDKKHILLTASRNRIAEERIEAFRYCAECHKRSLESMELNYMPCLPGDLGQLSGYKCGLELIREKKKTCILSASDYFSFGLITAFNEARWIPKKDYELVSVDDLESMGQLPFGKPFLSAININLPKVYSMGADLIVHLIEQKHGFSPLVSYRFPATFTRRETA